MDAGGSEGALAGLKVIDFSRHMAGPFATVILADHGADVIKVEGLPEGDPTRRMGVGGTIRGESGTFLMWNRGKRSIAVDMRSSEGLALLHDLIRTADVLVENYRPGIADTIGIGYEAMAAINPRLIYCSISAFGHHGPSAGKPGTDPVVQAMSGIMSVTGERDGDPVLVGAPIADFTGAMYAAQGILLAVLARERTGRGQLIEASMLFGMLSVLSTRLAWHWSTGMDPIRHGSAHNSLVPYQAFRTADGTAMAGTWGQETWPRFCEAIGREDLIDDPRFETNAQRLANRDELISIASEAMATRSTADWADRFEASGALFAPVQTLSEVFAQQDVIDAGMVQSIEHPTVGPIRQLAPPIMLSDTPGRIRRPPPLLGEHTREVLREIGVADSVVDDLLAKRVVKTTESSVPRSAGDDA